MALPTFQPSANVAMAFGERLPQILESFTTSKLLQLRLVCQSWREMINQILIKRGSIKLHFKLNRKALGCRSKCKDGIFYSFQNNFDYNLKSCSKHWSTDGRTVKLESGTRTMTNLLRLITQRSSASPTCFLPVNTFSYLMEGCEKQDKMHPQLLSFALHFGVNVKALTLDGILHYFMKTPKTPYFLLQFTPNLESLTIRNKSNADEYKDGSNKNTNSENEPTNKKQKEKTPDFSLPCLKYVEIVPSKQGTDDLTNTTVKILTHLLKIAPRLQRVSCPFLSDLSIVKAFSPCQLNLLHLEILELGSYPLFENGIEDLENLVQIMESMDHDRLPGVGLKSLNLIKTASKPHDETFFF